MNKRSEIINKRRHQTKFTILRHDSKDYKLCFHCDISHCMPIGAHVLAFAVYVLHIWFWEQKSSSSKRRFNWRILQGLFPVKTTQKWRHLFVLILLKCNIFAIRYIIWLNIAVRHETYQNLVFSFLTCVIEDSFMKYTYTAKILIHIYEEYMDKKRKKVLTKEGKSRNILKYFFLWLTNTFMDSEISASLGVELFYRFAFTSCE